MATFTAFIKLGAHATYPFRKSNIDDVSFITYLTATEASGVIHQLSIWLVKAAPLVTLWMMYLPLNINPKDDVSNLCHKLIRAASVKAWVSTVPSSSPTSGSSHPKKLRYSSAATATLTPQQDAPNVIGEYSRSRTTSRLPVPSPRSAVAVPHDVSSIPVPTVAPSIHRRPPNLQTPPRQSKSSSAAPPHSDSDESPPRAISEIIRRRHINKPSFDSSLSNSPAAPPTSPSARDVVSPALSAVGHVTSRSKRSALSIVIPTSSSPHPPSFSFSSSFPLAPSPSAFVPPRASSPSSFIPPHSLPVPPSGLPRRAPSPFPPTSIRSSPPSSSSSWIPRPTHFGPVPATPPPSPVKPSRYAVNSEQIIATRFRTPSRK